ncbi:MULTISPECIES: GNAT family N-acetyltransferase [Burkholderia cepacia complex]|uniref:GNAT family N-acetyltransferase n=1 Tax=Burkholderia semiarida TaxID=2843303 RepID=A0ABW7LA23_9BURK|nr:GNAT family N-acetyltransferase [Burkholderia anthina]RQV86605.1 N-acetyltransferase [Burkholderia anthina]
MDMQPVLLDVSDTLFTERLTIRCPRAGDGQKLFDATIESLDALREFPASLPWAIEPPSIDASEAYCRTRFADFSARRDFSFLMLLRDTETVVGCGGVHRPVWSIPAFDIGWWGRTPYLGQGLISEGVNALLRFAFSDLGARRVQALVDELNEKSWRLCERVGMGFEGTQQHSQIEPSGRLRNTKVYASVR